MMQYFVEKSLLTEDGSIDISLPHSEARTGVAFLHTSWKAIRVPLGRPIRTHTQKKTKRQNVCLVHSNSTAGTPREATGSHQMNP